MGINPQRVLLIRNSNAAQVSLSTSVADYYATARGLRGVGGNYLFLDADFGPAPANSLYVGCSRTYPTIPPTDPVMGGGPYGTPNGPLSMSIDALLVTGNSPTIGVTLGVTRLMAAIADLTAAGRIDAVLVTPGVPAAVVGPFPSGGVGAGAFYYPQPIEVYLSHASLLESQSANQKALFGSLYPQSIQAAGYEVQYPTTKFKAYPRFGKGRYRPNYGVAFGRIGWIDTVANAYSPLGANNLEVGSVRFIVQNAIAAERTNNRTLPHLIGGTNYIGQGSGENAALANQTAFALGCQDLFYLPTYTVNCVGTLTAGFARTVGTATTSAEVAPDSTIWPLQHGTVRMEFTSAIEVPGFVPEGRLYHVGEPFGDGRVRVNAPPNVRIPAGTPVIGRTYAWPEPAQAREYFGVLLSNGSQTASDYAPGAGVSQKTKFLPGAWTYSWQSSAVLHGTLCLRTGGSLGFCNLGEPFSAHLPNMTSLVINLMQGLTGAESAVFSIEQCSYVSAHGDPLYRPYAVSSFRQSELFTE